METRLYMNHNHNTSRPVIEDRQEATFIPNKMKTASCNNDASFPTVSSPPRRMDHNQSASIAKLEHQTAQQQQHQEQVNHQPQLIYNPKSGLPMVSSFSGSEHKVTHCYHDHANDPGGDYPAHQIVQATGSSNSPDQSFPARLHFLLKELEKDGLSHIISWMPHGRSFVVHDHKKFVDQILGNWFRQSKIASFQRQLNIYGFQRLTTGPDKNGYYHELFLRTKPGLAARIQRQKLKGTKTRRASSPESEPNFYAMTPMPPNAGVTPVEAPTPLTSACLPRTLHNSESASLTLQQIVPSLFSPVAFETRLHFAPQAHSGQQGLMATSSCNLALKPTKGITGNTAFFLTQFPLATTVLTTGTGNQSCVTQPSATAQTETFWVALGGGTSLLPNSENNRGSSVWRLR